VDFRHAVMLEAIKTLMSALLLLLTWLVGQKIVARWDVIKKQRELDIAVARDFQKLYGEFKEISRLWRICTYRGGKPNIKLPDSIAAELLRRATAAEGGVESIIMKLATERVLSEEDTRALGLFRQAYQMLREAIRDSQPLEWTHDSKEYHLYNDVASKVARLVSAGKIQTQKNAAAARKALRAITDVRPDNWKQSLATSDTPVEGHI
jgi:hypothetical protein